jgi:hypothetical protein
VLRPWLDDDRVASASSLLPAVDGYGALSGRDEENFFDIVGMSGHGLTAGEVVDQHRHGTRAVRPIDKPLQSG